MLAVTGLAGCSQLTATPAEPPRLESVRVLNHARERRTASVQLLLDGDVVYWGDFGIQAADPASGDDPRNVHSEPVERSAYPDERGRWTVRVRDQAADERSAATFTAEAFPGGCLTLRVDVGRDSGPAVMHRADTSCGDDAE